jgi:sugar-specific transcriptional regulator TrmB
MDHRELVNLGLTEKEAKVYLAALELGKSPVQKISQKAGVNRATTYVIIEGMMKKGLMSSYHEDKKQFFFAESPEKLSILFKNQEQEIKRKGEYLEKLLPELKGLNISKEGRPVVRYFEGKEGLRAMAHELSDLKGDEDMKIIYSFDLLAKIFSEKEFLEMRKVRQKRKVKARVILNDDLERYDGDAEFYRISSKKYLISCDIAFFNNKVRIATLKGSPIGIIIENQEIANTLKILFDLSWEYLKIQKNKKGPRNQIPGPCQRS